MRLFCIKEARKIRDPNLPKNPRPKDAKSVTQPPFSTLDENSLASLGLAYTFGVLQAAKSAAWPVIHSIAALA